MGTIPAKGTADPWDTAAAEVGGTRYAVRSRSSAVCKLARLLREPGVPDGPWEAYRTGGNGKPVMRGPSILAMAERTITEGDRDGLRWDKFRLWKGPNQDPTNEQTQSH